LEDVERCTGNGQGNPWFGLQKAKAEMKIPFRLSVNEKNPSVTDCLRIQ
jgi:hypothetical protein